MSICLILWCFEVLIRRLFFYSISLLLCWRRVILFIGMGWYYGLYFYILLILIRMIGFELVFVIY